MRIYRTTTVRYYCYIRVHRTQQSDVIVNIRLQVISDCCCVVWNRILTVISDCYFVVCNRILTVISDCCCVVCNRILTVISGCYCVVCNRILTVISDSYCVVCNRILTIISDCCVLYIRIYTISYNTTAVRYYSYIWVHRTQQQSDITVIYEYIRHNNSPILLLYTNI
jgi:hypothetical protein